MSSEDSKKREPVIFRISGNQLAVWVLPFPVIGFIACVILSVKYNFDQATFTHCRVANYLPSISAAIGGFTPQRYIWRICIGLHCAPRFAIAVMYYNFYRSHPVQKYRGLFEVFVGINSLLHILENLCLVVLSYISSTEDYKIHEASFIMFLVFSEFYMLLTLIIYYWAKSGQPWSPRELRSYRCKLGCFVLNLCACGAAAYFFWRHNAYCEPGIYTFFAACEYSVVLSNILFHLTGCFDFGDGQLCFINEPASKPKTS